MLPCVTRDHTCTNAIRNVSCNYVAIYAYIHTYTHYLYVHIPTHTTTNTNTHITYYGAIGYIGMIVGVILVVMLTAGVIIVFLSVAVKRKRKMARILQDQLDQPVSLSTR